MRTSVLRDFFQDRVKPSELAANLTDVWEQSGPQSRRLQMVDDMTEDFTVEIRHLVRLCDAVLGGQLPPNVLEAIGFGMVASDHLLWDGDTADGEQVAETVYDWASPEINYPLSLDNVAKFRHRLLTGENLFVQGQA